MVLKLAIIGLFLLSASLGINAQTIIDPEWTKTEVGTVDNRAEGWGLDVDEFGNVYWAVNAHNMNQSLDITCYKFNSNGTELWETPFFHGGIGRQQAYIVNASDTAIYLGGRNCISTLNTCDMLLLKVDTSSGNLIWDRTMNFSGNGYDELDGLELKEDGIYCGGWAHELENAVFKADMGFWKLDYNGNTIWTNHFGQAGSAEHQDGHFVVSDNYIYAAGLWDGKPNFTAYNGSAILAKFDRSDGSFVDSTLFGFQSDVLFDAENALGMTSHGDYLYITGHTTLPGASDWQIFVAKYDKNLNQIWYTDWGGSGAESARGITVVDDIVYVAGLSSSPSIITGGNRDAVLLKVDTNSQVLSYQTWGDTLKNSFLDISVHGNDIYLTGTSVIDEATEQFSAFLLKTTNTPTSIEKEIENNISFDIYPNPSPGHLQIQLNNHLDVEGRMTVTDVNGRLVSQKTISESENLIGISIDKRGVYFITIDNGVYRITKKIVVQ